MTPGGTACRLDRIGLNVGDLDRATAFYVAALGFVAAPASDADPALAALLGVRALRLVRLRRGRQALELSACDPPGALYPAHSLSNDLWFQHCALVTDDIDAAYARLGAHAFTPISRDGPQALPGGIVAFKFRDPDGHPLELIQFPHPDPRTAGGIDHTALSVADPARSIAFYAARLGLAVQARQVNAGPAQDALDGLDDVRVDVIGLAPPSPAPHVELLGYRNPPGRAAAPARPSDIAASRMVFVAEARTDDPRAAALADGTRVALLRDPDGHALLLER